MPLRYIDTVVNERGAALHGVPTHFLGALAEVDLAGEQLDLSKLRFIFTGIDKAFAYQDRSCGWITRFYRTHEATDNKVEPTRPTNASGMTMF